MPFFFFSRGRIGGLTWACGGLSIYYFDWQTVPDATAGSTISFRTRVGIAGCVYLFFLFLALDFGRTKVPNFAHCISTCFFHDRIIYHYFCHPFPPHDWTVHGSDTLVLHPLWSLLVRFLHVPPQHQKKRMVTRSWHCRVLPTSNWPILQRHRSIRLGHSYLIIHHMTYG